MAQQILQLTGQLSFKPVITEEKEITANGTYTPTAGKDGFSKVTVNVPSEEPILTDLVITADNIDSTIIPEAPVIGFNKVNAITSGVFQIDKSQIDQLAPGDSLEYMGLFTGIVITNNS